MIVGDGRYLDSFVKDINTRGVSDSFVFVPRQPAEIIPLLLSACDAAFVSFADNDLWKKTIPAKLQSYMACGMPIIASAGGETERIINEAGCGICCKVGDESELCAGIKSMMSADIDKFGKNGFEYCKTHFDKSKLMDEMDRYIGGSSPCEDIETKEKR